MGVVVVLLSEQIWGFVVSPRIMGRMPVVRVPPLDAKQGSRKKAKKGSRLQELKDLSGGSAAATADWAATITQRLDAAASSPEQEAKETELLAACGDASRDMELIDRVVGDLEAMPGVAAADATPVACGDWRLVWARSDEGVGAIGTGLHRVPLAKLEDIFLSVSPRRVIVSEIVRVMGPFPNIKNVLSGSSSVSPTTVAFSYDKVFDGTGKELTNSQARDVSFKLASLSKNVMVICATSLGSAEWLVFEREDDLAGALTALRVSTTEEDELPGVEA